MLTYEIFSYWIYIWFLLYYNRILNVSPLIFLMIGLLAVSINFFVRFKQRNRYRTIKVIIINLIIKIIPILLIFKTPIFNENDLIFGFMISYIYVITLLYFNKNPIYIYLRLGKNNCDGSLKKYKGFDSYIYDYLSKILINNIKND